MSSPSLSAAFPACKLIAASREADPAALAYNPRGLNHRVLFVSSDHVAASVLERQLGAGYEVHSAATDESAFALLDIYRYDCVVVDLCARSSAGAQAFSAIHLNALTTSVIAIVPSGGETILPPNTFACLDDDETIVRLAAIVRGQCGAR